MRPKKVILCANSDDADLSVQSFFLATSGYKILAAMTAEHAAGTFGTQQIDLVLITDREKLDAAALAKRMKAVAPHIPIIVLADAKQWAGKLHTADMLVHRVACAPDELLERIRTMAARKRGPRKGFKRPVLAGVA